MVFPAANLCSTGGATDQATCVTVRWQIHASFGDSGRSMYILSCEVTGDPLLQKFYIQPYTLMLRKTEHFMEETSLTLMMHFQIE